jgi:hypothetical protein
MDISLDSKTLFRKAPWTIDLSNVDIIFVEIVWFGFAQC